MNCKILFVVFVLPVCSPAPTPGYNYKPPINSPTLYDLPAVASRTPTHSIIDSRIIDSRSTLKEELLEDAQNLIEISPVLNEEENYSNYGFEWEVFDQESGNAYHHFQSSQDGKLQGEYRVLLPDGLIQIVQFYDTGNGYNAKVSYEM